MKPILFASFFALSAFALTANGAFAGNVSDGAALGQASEGTAHPTTCPPGQVLTTNPATGKQSCVLPDMAVKGSGTPKNSSSTVTIHKSVDSASPK